MKYLLNVLKGEALWFYTHNGPYASLVHAISAIENEFNSSTRQNQVKNELAAFRLPEIMVQNKLTYREELGTFALRYHQKFTCDLRNIDSKPTSDSSYAILLLV